MLDKILKHLEKNPKKTDIEYYIPSLWNNDYSESHQLKVNYNNFFKEKISKILALKEKKVNYNQSISKTKGEVHGIGGDWTYFSTIYNIFPRLTLAYDHDHDGHVGGNPKDITMSVSGQVRETGTFLKNIAFLEYIKHLGCNVLYFLPLTSIGQDGNRGDLGSPYAIKNQYKFDEKLADPDIPFTVEEQFKALVEAAHILGIRVVMEFVLRTSSLDGDWVKEHPEWFYWIDQKEAKNYKSPEFPQDELNIIKEIPKGGGFHFAPNKEYRSIFKAPPKPEEIKKVKGKYVAKTKDGNLVIPGAFADWPPDDIQPAWSDVTYLRMYDYPLDNENNNYNYIAYNTIRYYDPELAKDEHINRPLWDKLKGVIPYYQKEFGIDGVMMDMGHAVPKKLMGEIIVECRSIDPDFAIMEENFEIEWNSRNSGYNGTLGFEWRTTGLRQGGIKDVIHKSAENLALPFFGTPETHNTPRAMSRGGELHARQIWAINSFLPNCMPLIHSGFELYEDYPVNTGLNFTAEESQYFSTHHLGLFYLNAYDWNRHYNMISYITKINALRQKHFDLIATGNELSIKILYPEGGFGHIIAFERFDPWQPHQGILLIANTNYHHSETFYLNIPGTFNNQYTDYITEKSYTFVDNWLSATLHPGQVLIFEMHKLL